MANVIILARHGRTAWNVQRRIQGHQGTDLDTAGHKQAEDLAILLRGRTDLKIRRLICSSLPRARQTGEVIGRQLHLAVETDDRLWECGFGSLEGLTYDEAITQHGNNLRPHLEKWGFVYDFRPFGGEHRQGVVDRQLHLLNDLAGVGGKHTYLLIGHGRAFNSLILQRWPNVPSLQNNCDFRVVAL